MINRGKAPRYCAYVLRCWNEHANEAHQLTPWRFSLEEIDSGKRHGFATLQALLAFLQSELDSSADGTSSELPTRAHGGETPLS